MADLSINRSETVKINEGAGQNPIFNGTFETAPSFTAATTTASRWVDGTAGGSTTNDAYGWATVTMTGTVAAQFDSSTSSSGTYSFKISTQATGSRIDTGSILSASNALNVFKYGIPVLASTLYRVTFAMRTNLVSGASSSGATLRIQEYGITGTSGAVTNSSVVSTTTAWTNYSFNVTTASTAAYIAVIPQVIGNAGTATLILDAWFDNINVQSASRLAGVDLPLGAIVKPGIQDISGPKIWS